MIRFENTVEISRPIGEVFSFLAQFDNLPRWNYYVVQVCQTSTGVPGEGTVYHQTRRDDEQDFQITAYQPNHLLAVRTTSGSHPAFERAFNLEEIPAGTRITDSWELETGRSSLLERLATGRVKGAVAQNLTKLKELLEHGQTRLQDGRISTL